jgi:pantoate--beta-alanine ligase
VREADELALSARNAYLSPAERKVAPALHRVLSETAARIIRGAVVALSAAAGVAALSEAGFTKVDYLEICDAETLTPLQRPDRPGRVLAAAWLGKTRLIDNIPLPIQG